MTDEQQVDPSVTQALTSIRAKHERYKKNKQNVVYCTAMLPIKEKILREALGSLEYYQKLCPELTNDIALMRKRLEFSTNYLYEHEEQGNEIKEAEAIARKIKKLEQQMIELRKKQAEVELSPNVGS